MTGLSAQCWPHRGALNPNGYGSAGLGNQVHRLAYEALVGPVPAGLELDHLCRNRACYNPAHLEPVTHAENMRRAVIARNGGDQCPHGHPYDEPNTYRSPSGRRVCRTCTREAGRRYDLTRRGVRHGTPR